MSSPPSTLSEVQPRDIDSQLEREPAVDPRRVDPAHRQASLDFARTVGAETLDEAGQQLAVLVAERIDARVLLAVCNLPGKRFRLIGDSENLEAPQQLRTGEPLEQALSESLVLGLSQEAACLDATSDLDTPIRAELAHRYGVHGARVCLLADSKRDVQGALITLHDRSISEGLEEKLGNQDSLSDLAAYLRLRREADASWQKRLGADAGAMMRSKRAGAWTAAVLALVGAMAIPVPHEIGADCQCEPAVRRLVAAPFDAQLAQCFVKPGDRVAADDLLATFEGGEISSEIEALAAERSRMQQQLDAATVSGDSLSAAEAALDVQRLTSKIDLLRQRQQRLELRSPIAGIVVSGDLEESIGASLAIGQRLLEIAPLDRMVAEVAVDESDINLVSVGQQASLRFDGIGDRDFNARITRIFPRAEVVDGQNVFIAESEIQGDPELLSPGMRGRAKVHEGWRPLGWLLFKSPFTAIRRFWGWY